MPTYEYKCPKCKENFELKLGFFHNKKDEKCPKCGSPEVDRVFSPISSKSSGSSCGGSSTPRSFG